ncbi:DegV family protein [Falsibacillus pallidus]|uniref:DegV family protein n=1 Tax=Falsibacillus pallidus TaxID=493781 RepID=UPI003D98F6B9
MVQIITDSSSDLPKELLDRYNITVVPLTVRIDEKEYLEGVNLDPEQFYEKMFASDQLPKTSQPSPSVFAGVFEELKDKGELLCLTISSGLSGTYQSACMAKDLTEANVEVFDTLGGSLAHGILILKAAALAEQGLERAAILKKLHEWREDMKILILLDTLENVVKGGRLSKFQGSIAKVLNIKVILEGIKGEIEVIEKIRGQKKFLKRSVEMIGERRSDFSDTIFGITHTGNVEDAEYMKREIQSLYNPKEVIIHYMGATMGTYAGKNGMIVSFI